MIKLISVKTRRPDTSREAFRAHYEGRHVPLGLGFLEHFRWRRYARNHVLRTLLGRVDFDCLTEFWIASESDRARTAAFVASPGFRVLDEDDARFLDVTRRLSFDVEEGLLAGAPRPPAPVGTRRIAQLFPQPAWLPFEDFVRRLREVGHRLGERSPEAWERVTLDVRVTADPRPRELAAILSLWPRAGAPSPAVVATDDPAPEAIVELEVVETPREALYRPEDPPNGAAGPSPSPATRQEERLR